MLGLITFFLFLSSEEFRDVFFIHSFVVGFEAAASATQGCTVCGRDGCMYLDSQITCGE